MRRLNEDSGAIALLVAILLVALLGIGAIVIDVGALYVERRQLQNGADAAALAVAQNCAGGSCGNANATATTYASANAGDGSANATVTFPAPGRVVVTTSTRTADGGSALAHWLAPLLGTDSTTVVARSTAAWGQVGEGALPLTMSVCEWNLLTGYNPVTGSRTLPTGLRTVYFHTQTQSQNNRCDGPAGQDLPGGFGWLAVPNSAACQATVRAGRWMAADPGNSVPGPANSTGCTSSYFASLIGRTVLMPVFAGVTGSGSNGQYWIDGFAGFQITGYRFGGSDPVVNAPCGNPDRCVRGRFVAYYDLNAPLDPSATDYGALAVNLIE